jgi:hypothetical protein
MDKIFDFNDTWIKILNLVTFITIGGMIVLAITQTYEGFYNHLVGIGLGITFLIAAYIAFRNAQLIGQKGNIRKALIFIGVANAFFAAGQFVWSFYNMVLQVDIPYPSLADIFFLGMTIPLAMTAGTLVQFYSQSVTKKTFIEAFIIFIILGSLAGFTLFRPEISTEATFWENFFNSAYPIVDSLYVGIIFAGLRIAGGRFFTGYMIWAIALLVITIADLLFTYRANSGDIYNGDISDTFYLISGYLFALSSMALAKGSIRKRPEGQVIPNINA